MGPLEAIWNSIKVFFGGEHKDAGSEEASAKAAAEAAAEGDWQSESQHNQDQFDDIDRETNPQGQSEPKSGHDLDSGGSEGGSSSNGWPGSGDVGTSGSDGGSHSGTSGSGYGSGAS